MLEQERNIQQSRLFNTFDRVGQIVQVAETPRQTSEYEIIQLGPDTLSPADAVVREVESDFAAEYDSAQFTTPGMKEMAERDTRLLEEWIGNPNGQRGIDIGPGTGRITLPLADTVGPNGRVYAVETAKPYLTQLIAKAAEAGIDPDRLRLAVGDMQNVSSEELKRLTEGAELDFATLWFGPITLMTTNPQRVLDNAAALLKKGGSLLLTTNSLNGLAYRVPEAAIAQGENPETPLGYRPSIFTRRSFAPGDRENPNGMILGTNQVLPATFYDPSRLTSMLERAGLEVTDVRGISRLSSLLPADMQNTDALGKYINIVSGIDQQAGTAMRVANGNPNWVFGVARDSDVRRAKDPTVLSEFTYAAVKAVKAR